MQLACGRHVLFLIVCYQQSEADLKSDELYRVDYKLIAIPVVFMLLRIWSVILTVYLFKKNEIAIGKTQLFLLAMTVSDIVCLSL